MVNILGQPSASCDSAPVPAVPFALFPREMLREASAHAFPSLAQRIIAVFKAMESEYVAKSLAGINVDRY
jgi:hypothetical protein